MSPKHSTRKHSDFAASSASRWLVCPASVELCKKVPPSIDTKASLEGTNAHECLEFLTRAALNGEEALLEAFNVAETKWPSPGKGYDPEMLDHALDAAETIFDLRPSETATLEIENKVYLSQIDERMFGTLDYAWIDLWGRLVVIDFKFGKFPVEARYSDGRPNPQLMYYALAVAMKHDYEFEEVELVVIQPRAFRESESIYSSTKVSMKELTKFAAEIAGAVLEASKPNPKFVATDEGCKWCPAKSICPELSKNALGDLDNPFDLETLDDVRPFDLEVTPRSLPKLLNACDRLETWIDAIRAHAKELLEGQIKIDGYELVPKRAVRYWNKNAEMLAKHQFGDEVFERKMLSPAQFLKRFKGKNGEDFVERHTVFLSSGVNLKATSKQNDVFDVEEI